MIDSFHEGGSERQAIQLTRLLHESGRFQVLLACLSPDGPLRNEVAALELAEIPAFPLKKFYDLNAFAQLRKFVRYLKNSKVDVLQTHDFYTNVFGMFAGALARVPVRIAARRETTGMRSAAQHKVQGLAYSLAHQVIANSEAGRSQLMAERVKTGKISVIYNGLNTARVAPEPAVTRDTALAALGFTEKHSSRRFVTVVANMRLEVKDYPMLLRTARRVVDAVPQAAFLLAGEGELKQSLEGLALDLKLDNDVFFLGRCKKLAELFALSDVCVLTSKTEGFSNAILEYMAAGRPVVATDVGGAREAIIEGETGYLVSAGDDAAMAERITLLLRDANKAFAMGQAGRRVVDAKFSPDSQLRRTEELYETLLSAANGRRLVAVKSATRESV